VLLETADSSGLVVICEFEPSEGGIKAVAWAGPVRDALIMLTGGGSVSIRARRASAPETDTEDMEEEVSDAMEEELSDTTENSAEDSEEAADGHDENGDDGQESTDDGEASYGVNGDWITFLYTVPRRRGWASHGGRRGPSVLRYDIRRREAVRLGIWNDVERLLRRARNGSR
jgi:hypothetical protein